jgi:hypothetical protein
MAVSADHEFDRLGLAYLSELIPHSTRCSFDTEHATQAKERNHSGQSQLHHDHIAIVSTAGSGSPVSSLSSKGHCSDSFTIGVGFEIKPKGLSIMHSPGWGL